MNALLDIIKDQIAQDGPLSVADYMQLCLGHPEHGYYMKYDPFGREGDFITSPEISQIFGELLGLWCADMWQQMGGGPAALVEIGPGRGTLMKDALRATQQLPGFHDHLTIHMIETSPRLANMQYHALREMHPRIEWLDGIQELPAKPVLLVANEFFDALPIKQFVKTANGLEERKVDWDDEEQKLVFITQPAGLSLAKGNDGLAEGKIVESCPAARGVMGDIASHMAQHGGASVIIDYGYIGEAQSDTLQAVKAHQFASVLDQPGEADLTAHVDFSALAEVAEAKKLRCFGPVDQGAFLTRLGAEIRAQNLLKVAAPDQKEAIVSGLSRLIAPEQMGTLFKVLAVTSSVSVVPNGFG